MNETSINSFPYSDGVKNLPEKENTTIEGLMKINDNKIAKMVIFLASGLKNSFHGINSYLIFQDIYLHESTVVFVGFKQLTREQKATGLELTTFPFSHLRIFLCLMKNGSG